MSHPPAPEHLPVGALSRRRFVTGALSAGLLAASGAPLAARQGAPANMPVLRGNDIDLRIGYQTVNFTGRESLATTVNGTLPGPVLRWREGDRVTIRVTNNLAEDTSIHWHGLILPWHQDGVPGLSFPGIRPGETFTYSFQIRQSGTYWYHSHSGFQEQTGHLGAIIIDPAQPDPVAFDRQHVILLSDWSDENPHTIFAKLRKESHYYNFHRRTAADLWRDIRDKGAAQVWQERQMWNAMRMSDRDLADVTGHTYTFLMNGQPPVQPWQALFAQGEKVRLRIINGSAMTLFDFRIPGLKMTVVAADGQNIEPVTVDEFRIGVAETYDVIVEPVADRAYALYAQSMDRSGYAVGTLTPNPAWGAEIPAMDHRPVLGHRDMGMGDNGQHDHDNHGLPGDEDQVSAEQDHGHHRGHGTTGRSLGRAGMGSSEPINHQASESSPQVDMRAEAPVSGLHDPGVGLRHHHHRYGRTVLNYGDIRNLDKTLDPRDPEREIQLHLTGNMYRYLWSFDGIPFADALPLQWRLGERLRITLVNDTMMTHPIHLHGMWSELETGDADHIPRKHTVLVQPGSTISYLVTADAPGPWAYHCHLMYHMGGMFREVRVGEGEPS